MARKKRRVLEPVRVRNGRRAVVARAPHGAPLPALQGAPLRSVERRGVCAKLAVDRRHWLDASSAQYIE